MEIMYLSEDVQKHIEVSAEDFYANLTAEDAFFSGSQAQVNASD